MHIAETGGLNIDFGMIFTVVGVVVGVIGGVVAWQVTKHARNAFHKAGNEFSRETRQAIRDFKDGVEDGRKIWDGVRVSVKSEWENLESRFEQMNLSVTTLRTTIDAQVPSLATTLGNLHERINALQSVAKDACASVGGGGVPADLDPLTHALSARLDDLARLTESHGHLIEALPVSVCTALREWLDGRVRPAPGPSWGEFIPPEFSQRRPSIEFRKWRSIAFYNRKGGVGKTTLAFNVAHALAAKHGARVLLVDCDTQANLSSLTLGADEISHLTANQVLGGMLRERYHAGTGYEKSLRDWALPSIHHTGVRIVPNKFGEVRVDDHLVRVSAAGDDPRGWWIEWLDDKLGYDYIIFDCPPALGFVTQATIAAADFIVVPVTPSEVVMQGVKQLRKGISEWRSLLGERTESPIGAIVLNRFEDEEQSEQYHLHFENDRVLKSWVGASDNSFTNARKPWSIEIDATRSQAHVRVQKQLLAVANEIKAMVDAATEVEA